MLVSSLNLSQSFNYAPYLYCKKQFKTEINCFCIRTLYAESVYIIKYECALVHAFRDGQKVRGCESSSNNLGAISTSA